MIVKCPVFFSLLLLRKEIISTLVRQYHEDKKKTCQTSNIPLDINSVMSSEGDQKVAGTYCMTFYNRRAQ